MSEFIRCPRCRGKAKVLGLGMIVRNCDTCAGAGWVKREEEDVKDSKNYAEQDNVKDSQNAEAKENVDQGASNNCKGKRKRDRKATVGTGKQDLSEREESREGREKIGCDESEEVKSSESL